MSSIDSSATNSEIVQERMWFLAVCCSIRTILVVASITIEQTPSERWKNDRRYSLFMLVSYQTAAPAFLLIKRSARDGPDCANTTLEDAITFAFYGETPSMTPINRLLG